MANNTSGLISGLTGMVNRIKMSILKKFRAFYIKRVHETDLAPTKTFSFDFDISSSGVAHRKSVSKLKALIVKNLVKNTPAVALAENEFLPADGANSSIRINMFRLELGANKPPVNKKVLQRLLGENRLDQKSIEDITFVQIRNYSRISSSIIRSTVKYLQLERYLRYLEYQCRKHGVPVSLQIGYDLDEGNSTDTYNVYPVFIVARFGAWIPATGDAERRFADVNNGNPNDALFSRRDDWTLADFSHMPASAKFKIAVFFVHLDKAVKVIDTLSRKIDYGYNAFSFRTA